MFIIFIILKHNGSAVKDAELVNWKADSTGSRPEHRMMGVCV